MKIILKLTLLLFVSYTSLGQNEKIEFETAADYLEYVNSNYSIPQDEIYYFSTESDSLSVFEKIDILLFITNNKLATVGEVADYINVSCSPKKLLPQITEEAIQEVATPTANFKNMVFKKLSTGEKLSKEHKAIALYFFSISMGKNATMYYKEREHFEKLGYETIVVTLDGSIIKDVPDIDKEPISKGK